MTTTDDIPSTLREAIDQRNSLREVIQNMADASVKKDAEIERLTEALAASDADRDRMAQQLALAQSEARGLREELRRISAPNGGVA